MGKRKVDDKVKRFCRNVRYALKNPLTYLILFIILLICLATYIVELTETKTDSGITGWFDAIWHTIVAVVAAYYDFYVKSVPGRLASIVLLLFGMALFSMVSATITSTIMNIQMKKNKGLKKLKKMKGHFLLCGWRPGFDKILEALMNSNPDIDTENIVLINDAPSENIEQLKSDIRFKDINYISGDFSDATVLKRACIEKASRALVISDTSKEHSEMETDSRTVLAVLSLKNLNPTIYVAAEILDEKFEEHLKLAACNEIILTQNYQHSLLATASSGLGYSNVIKALIGNDADSGVIVRDIDDKFINKTYGEFSKFIDSCPSDKELSEGALLVGLVLNTNGKTNEPLLTPEDSFVIPENTRAILVQA